MDAFLHDKQIIYKGDKFGFHKRLSRGIKRWKCTKYRCKAYIKTDGDNENNVIFERLNHTHEADNDDSWSTTSSRNDNDAGFKLTPAKPSLEWLHKEANTSNNSMQTEESDTVDKSMRTDELPPFMKKKYSLEGTSDEEDADLLSKDKSYKMGRLKKYQKNAMGSYVGRLWKL